ncbi:hypothetical protein TNCT_143421 [Trichonephila clavata]|uniref:Uncharacterized protein n=1 Tax=Trichonephila clavata TaxID=2740835 RepID=A0A8X6G8L3_TRICU|nr:hypothetical protein TNCT_143421 [Trichonephila clavata]
MEQSTEAETELLSRNFVYTIFIKAPEGSEEGFGALKFNALRYPIYTQPDSSWKNSLNMEKKTLPSDDGNLRKFSDEDYWQSAHKGFDFNESSWSLSIPPSSLGNLSSAIRENDALNQYELLRCDGLSEVAENSMKFCAFVKVCSSLNDTSI